MMPIISNRFRFRHRSAAALAVAVTLAGCAPAPPQPAGRTDASPTAPATTEPAIRIVVLGDSLAAGLGLAAEDAFPDVLEDMMRERQLDVEVVNAGVSGDTTAGGLSRIDWVLQRPTDLLVVELGGNDALRGQPAANTERNLREIVRSGRAAGARVILLGMDVPSNYGPDYGAAFAEIYPRVAAEEGAVLVPGFVRELGADPTLLQADGLHPTAEGQRKLAERLLPTVVEVVEELEPKPGPEP